MEPRTLIMGCNACLDLKLAPGTCAWAVAPTGLSIQFGPA